FWEHKRLEGMSREEWESLCDGCGLCCLHKLEDEETGEVHYTRVACRLLDPVSIRCRRYRQRHRYVPDCLRLTPELVGRLKWLPETCAYRRIAEGRGLPDWHPLITGDPESVHRAGVSVRGRIIDEREAGDLEDHLWKPNSGED
ncbi:MAG: YcgN family cysteine cluster protein, partial [Alphaproteobacteria bacterium]